MKLLSGFGISLVNDRYEELVYVTLRNIRINYLTTEAGQDLSATIERLQVWSNTNIHNPLIL